MTYSYSLFSSKLLRWSFNMIVFLFLSASMLYSAARTYPRLAFLLGRETRHEYLLNRASNYPACSYINSNTPAEAIILCLDPRGYYLDRYYYYAYFPTAITPLIPQWTTTDSSSILKGWEQLHITHLKIFWDYRNLKEGRVLHAIVSLSEKSNQLSVHDIVTATGGKIVQDDILQYLTKHSIPITANNSIILNEKMVSHITQNPHYQCIMHLLNLKNNFTEEFRENNIAVYRIDYAPQRDRNVTYESFVYGE